MKRDYTTTPEMVEAFEVTESNENYEGCKKCGGRCCMNMGCEIFPQDVKKWFNTTIITKEIIFKMLNTGMVQVDWWEGDVRDEFNYPYEAFEEMECMDKTYYLHMRNRRDYVIAGSWCGGVCKALTPYGCSIPWDKRPTGGKALIPSPIGNPRECVEAEVSKAECCLAWIPYQDIFQEVVSEYKDPSGESRLDFEARMIMES